MPWWETGLRLFLAVVIGCIIGIEREHKSRPAGMRTHILVCLGAAIVALIECSLLLENIDLSSKYTDTGISVNMGSMSAQVISGIGFLGAGTIMVTQKRIAGLTTAASVWCAACLGLASGMGHYAIAVSGCTIVMVTLTLMQRLVKVNTIKHVEIQFIHRVETLNYINEYFARTGIKVLDVDFNVQVQEKRNVYTNLYTLNMPRKTTYADIITELSEYSNIRGIRTRNVQ